MDFKKIILTMLVFSISLLIISPIYADDLPELDSGSSSVLIPDEAIDDIATTIILIGSEDEQDKGYSKIGNSTLKEEIVSEIKASAATEYTTTDIYNFIYSAMRGQSTSSTYSLPFIARLLNTIRDEVHGNSTFAANAVTLYDYVKELCEGNEDWDYAVGPLQFMSDEFDWRLVDGDVLETIQYSVKDLLGFIYVDCDDIVDKISSIDLSFDSTNTYLYGIEYDTERIRNTVNNINTLTNTANNTLSNINNNISSVDQNIGGLRDNINDIGWIYSGDTVGAYYYTNNTLDISNPIDLSVSGNYSDIPYFSYQMKTPLTDKVIYKAELPIYRNSLNYIDTLPDEVKFYYYYNNILYTIYDIDYIVLNGRSTAEVYFIMSKGYGYNNINLIIKPIYTSGTYSHTSGIIGQLSYVESSKQDYWTMYDIIKKQKNYNNLEKLTNVYASDDMIAQKEAQQPVETQVLEDFTGSGSESMSLGDVVDVKSVSSSVKSALNAGGSASNALNILNSSNNMWQWFTNTTKTNINGNNNRKNAIDDNSEYISIYELNLEQYYRGLGDGKSN